ncbi:hypothetical protein [Orenia marismortui]|nr:hypothetical protein [Orenia marismortui]
MIYTVFYNSGESLEDIDSWDMDRLIEAYKALEVINESVKEQVGSGE